jgi:hypothetical protein
MRAVSIMLSSFLPHPHKSIDATSSRLVPSFMDMTSILRRDKTGWRSGGPPPVDTAHTAIMAACRFPALERRALKEPIVRNA